MVYLPSASAQLTGVARVRELSTIMKVLMCR